MFPNRKRATVHFPIFVATIAAGTLFSALADVPKGYAVAFDNSQLFNHKSREIPNYEAERTATVAMDRRRARQDGDMSNAALAPSEPIARDRGNVLQDRSFPSLTSRAVASDGPIVDDEDSPTSSVVSGSWPRASIQWPEERVVCGSGEAVIGMIDGPIDLNDPSLLGQAIIYRSFTDDTPGISDYDHGTAIASILVGSGRSPVSGLLPNATLYAASVFGANQNGIGRTGSVSSAVEALDWMISEGVKVINLSFETRFSAALSSALIRAAQEGVILVAAAGNGGPHAPAAYPAAHPDVIAVTGVDSDLRASPKSNQGYYIDFSAPGVGVPTNSLRGHRYHSGTSFAAPFVTALIAARRVPDSGARRRAHVVAELARTAVDLGEQGRDPVYGWGVPVLSGAC